MPARDEFPIRDVSSWLTRDDEPMGTKPKVWVQEHRAAPLHLFKYVRRDEVGGTYGDDWAEKLATELAGLLGLPAAEVDLARREDAVGVVSLRIDDPDRLDLVHGNELLAGREPAYDKELRREHPLYTVDAVRACLAGTEPPPGTADDLPDGFAVWAGYLVLDALIANTDRHHENWAVLVDQRTRATRLSPSFDHGSSLGFNVPAARLVRMTEDRTLLRRWCERGRSGHFAGRPSLVDVAAEALALAGPTTRGRWLDNLGGLRPEDWNRVIDHIPGARMSAVARTFVGAVLETNRRRLLDVHDRPS